MINHPTSFLCVLNLRVLIDALHRQVAGIGNFLVLHTINLKASSVSRSMPTRSGVGGPAIIRPVIREQTSAI